MSTLKTTNLSHPSAATPNMVLASTGAVTFGGAVVGGGMDLVASSTFSAVSTVSINNCFSSTYANYRIMISSYSSAGGYLSLKLRAASVDDSTNYYDQSSYGQSTSVGAERYGSKTTGMHTVYLNVTAASPSVSAVDIYSPALAIKSYLTAISGYGAASVLTTMSFTGFHDVATAYDGLTLLCDAGGTITGTVRVYGYKNA